MSDPAIIPIALFGLGCFGIFFFGLIEFLETTDDIERNAKDEEDAEE